VFQILFNPTKGRGKTTRRKKGKKAIRKGRKGGEGKKGGFVIS
jgi:hypothetical protein